MTTFNCKYDRNTAIVYNAPGEIQVDTPRGGMRDVHHPRPIRSKSRIYILNHRLETKKAGVNPAFFVLAQTHLLSAAFFDFLDLDFLAGLLDFLVATFGA